MPRLPTKLIVFVIVGGFFWIYLAPKRAELAKGIIRKKRMARFEDSIQILVEEKIRKDICGWEDMCEYRPNSWRISRTDATGAEAVHQFFADNSLRKYIFRIRNGAVSEVIDLR